MAEVYPFIGTRYNSQLIGDLGKVVCPPCDAITEEMQDALYDLHENNAVRLEKVRTEGDEDGFLNRFDLAANTLGTWRSDGVIIEDEKPSFYVVEQIFDGPDGEKLSRVGFVGKVKLDEGTPVDRDAVDSLTGVRADCVNLIRSTNANINGVSALFSDADGSVRELLASRMKERPWEEFKDGCGVKHRLWVVQKKDVLLGLVDSFKDKGLFVAEGHQRYMAAQLFREEMRGETGKSDGKQAFDYIMMTLYPAEQEGLSFHPMHRGLTRAVMADVDLKDALVELEDYFDIKKVKVDLSRPAEEAVRLEKALAKLGTERPAFTMIHGSGAGFHLVLQEGVDMADLYEFDDATMPECAASLDACVLHNFVVNQVFIGNPEYELEDDECIYEVSSERLLSLLAAKKILCGFLMNPLSKDRMLEVAEKKSVVHHEMGVLSPRGCIGLVLRNLQADVRKTGRK